MRLRTEEINVRYLFTNDDIAALAKEQADHFQRRTKAENDLAAVKKQFGATIAEHAAKIYSASTKISNGFEMRDIKALVLRERPEGYKTLIRTDTAFVHRIEKLLPDDRQMELVTEEPEPWLYLVRFSIEDPAYADSDIWLPVWKAEWDLIEGKPGIIEVRPPTVALNPGTIDIKPE